MPPPPGPGAIRRPALGAPGVAAAARVPLATALTRLPPLSTPQSQRRLPPLGEKQEASSPGLGASLRRCSSLIIETPHSREKSSSRRTEAFSAPTTPSSPTATFLAGGVEDALRRELPMRQGSAASTGARQGSAASRSGSAASRSGSAASRQGSAACGTRRNSQPCLPMLPLAGGRAEKTSSSGELPKYEAAATNRQEKTAPLDDFRETRAGFKGAHTSIVDTRPLRSSSVPMMASRAVAKPALRARSGARGGGRRVRFHLRQSQLCDGAHWHDGGSGEEEEQASVVHSNPDASFPDNPVDEVDVLCKKLQRQLADLKRRHAAVESPRTASVLEKELISASV